MSIFPFFQVSFFRFHFAFQGSTPIGAIFELLTVGEHPLGVICIIVFIIKLFCCPVGTGSMLDFKVKQSFYATWKGSMASHSYACLGLSSYPHILIKPPNLGVVNAIYFSRWYTSELYLLRFQLPSGCCQEKRNVTQIYEWFQGPAP